MLSHDVVVVGAGLAGMRAAIAAHEAGVDVALVTKVHPVRSHSGAAQGGINAALGNQTDDKPENHTFDTVKGADYIGDQDAIEILCESAPREIIQLEHWGAVFSRHETTGKIAQRPFGGAGFPRTCFAADLTGLVILHTLYTVCVKYEIPTYEEWFVTELVKDSHGGCCGVVAYDMVHGNIQTIGAKAVVLATGSKDLGGGARYIESGQEAHLAAGAKTSMLKLLQQRNVWGIAIPRLLADPTWGTLAFWVPFYLTTERGFDLKQIAMFAWLPFVTADLGCLAGPTSCYGCRSGASD